MMGRIQLRWAVEFLSALAALDSAAFASDLDSTALSGAVDFQATYATVQYLSLGDIVCSGFGSDYRDSRFGSIFGVFSWLEPLLGSYRYRLLRILAAELDRHHSVLLGDWVRRVLNGHGDGLSRVAPFIPSLQRSQADSDRWTFEFVVRDIKSGEARVATLTLPRDCGAGMVASPTKV